MYLKKTKIFITVFTIILVLFFILFSIVFVDFFQRDVKQKYNITYYTEKENYQPSIWLFKGIDVDSKRNIYIACNNALLVFNKNGKCIASVHIPSSSEKTAFKIDNNQLIIISNMDIEGFTSSAYTYEMKYDLHFDDKEIEGGVPEYDYKHKQNFSDFKEKNEFKNKESAEYKGVTYSYDFYGKINGSDGAVINLDVSYWPIPLSFTTIPMGVCIIVIMGLLVHLLIKKKKTN